uniref:transmembrane protein 208 isoform X2 n=1 Tax=Myxine glutinosa TaxID=7769 RepID=UPI00358F6BB4
MPVIYVLRHLPILSNSSSFWTWSLLVCALAVNVCSYLAMSSMARALYAPDGSLMDGGIDLNMEQGIAEHLKDVILLTCIVLILSCISTYFWFLWLLAPARAVYMLWQHVLRPWLTAGSDPQQQEAPDKKQRKIERRQKRS